MRLGAIIAGGLMLLSTDGSAAVVTETGSYALSALPTGGTSTTLSIGKFDGSLGALLGVEIELTGTSGGLFTVRRNNTGFSGTLAFNAVVGADYTLGVNATTLFTLDVDSATVTVFANRNRTVSSTANTGTAGAVAQLTSPAMLAFFTGPGSAVFSLGIVRENGLVPPLPVNAGAGVWPIYTYGNEASAVLTVLYTYATPIGVPEPLALSLFGMALGALALATGRCSAA